MLSSMMPSSTTPTTATNNSQPSPLVAGKLYRFVIAREMHTTTRLLFPNQNREGLSSSQIKTGDIFVLLSLESSYLLQTTIAGQILLPTGDVGWGLFGIDELIPFDPNNPVL